MYYNHYYGPDSLVSYLRYELCIVVLDHTGKSLLTPLNKSGERDAIILTDKDLIFYIPHLQTYQQHTDIVSMIELRKEYS